MTTAGQKRNHKIGKVILGMAMSLDGFVNDRNGSVDRLYPDLEALTKTKIMVDSIRDTGAVVMGRHAFAMSEDPDLYAASYEFQVPIIVLTHNRPEKQPKENDRLKFIFVSDGIESAIEKAYAVAGDKNVAVIGGASTAQQCLSAGLVDELHVDLMTVLLGGGLRFFENIDSERIRLEKIEVLESVKGGTYIRFRVEYVGRSDV